MQPMRSRVIEWRGQKDPRRKEDTETGKGKKLEHPQKEKNAENMKCT
jgi:hypothetical protein